MIKVLIADDQILLRKSLGRLLDANSDIEIIGLVENGQEAVDKVLELSPDVVMLDIEMPVLNGVKALEIIKENKPNVKVIMLTTFDNRENLKRAFLASADGYLSKEVSPEELISAIRCVYSGLYVFNDTAKEFIVESINAEFSKPEVKVFELSDDEVEIVRLIIQGKSNKSIADMLSYSEGTIKNKVSKIYEKVGVNDRVKLAIYGIENGIS